MNNILVVKKSIFNKRIAETKKNTI